MALSASDNISPKACLRPDLPDERHCQSDKEPRTKAGSKRKLQADDTNNNQDATNPEPAGRKKARKPLPTAPIRTRNQTPRVNKKTGIPSVLVSSVAIGTPGFPTCPVSTSTQDAVLVHAPGVRPTASTAAPGFGISPPVTSTHNLDSALGSAVSLEKMNATFVFHLSPSPTLTGTPTPTVLTATSAVFGATAGINVGSISSRELYGDPLPVPAHSATLDLQQPLTLSGEGKVFNTLPVPDDPAPYPAQQAAQWWWAIEATKRVEAARQGTQGCGDSSWWSNVWCDIFIRKDKKTTEVAEAAASRGQWEAHWTNWKFLTRKCGDTEAAWTPFEEVEGTQQPWVEAREKYKELQGLLTSTTTEIRGMMEAARQKEAKARTELGQLESEDGEFHQMWTEWLNLENGPAGGARDAWGQDTHYAGLPDSS